MPHNANKFIFQLKNFLIFIVTHFLSIVKFSRL